MLLILSASYQQIIHNHTDSVKSCKYLLNETLPDSWAGRNSEQQTCILEETLVGVDPAQLLCLFIQHQLLIRTSQIDFSELLPLWHSSSNFLQHWDGKWLCLNCGINCALVITTNTLWPMGFRNAKSGCGLITNFYRPENTFLLYAFEFLLYGRAQCVGYRVCLLKYWCCVFPQVQLSCDTFGSSQFQLEYISVPSFKVFDLYVLILINLELTDWRWKKVFPI